MLSIVLKILSSLFILNSCRAPEKEDSDPFLDDSSEQEQEVDSTIEEPCEQGIEVSVSSDWMLSGDTLYFGESPAYGPRLTMVLEVYNPCQEKVRLLGHPDDWITGVGFGIEQLPAVSVDGGQTSVMSISFQPEELGTFEGKLSLPHTHPESPFEGNLSASTGAALTLVLVGDGRHTATTLDYGSTFEYDHFETLVPNSNLHQRGVCWGKDRFISVGGVDQQGLWHSTDGLLWEDLSGPGTPIRDCAYGGELFVAIADTPLYSSDGENWVAGTSENQDNALNDLTYGNGVFVAVGENGRATMTVDGSHWESDILIGEHNLHQLFYGAGRFVAIGDNGTVATSLDGVLWVVNQVGDGSRWDGIVYGNEQFIIGNGSELMSSSDGRHWSLLTYSSVVPMSSIGTLLLGIGGNSFFQSEDGGHNWLQTYSFAAGLSLKEAVFSED